MAKSEDLESDDNEDSKKKKTATKKVAKKATKKAAKKATKKVEKESLTEISKDEIDDESKDVVSPEIEADPGPPPPDEVNLLEFQEKSMSRGGDGWQSWDHTISTAGESGRPQA